MKHLQNKRTKEIATYHNGIFRTNEFCIELGVEPSSEFWVELRGTYPPGTRVEDTYELTFGYIYEKLDTGYWKLGSQGYYTISDQSIGENKRFRLLDQDTRPVLEYKDLINGEIYTTDYPDQGLYTFKEGYNLWISHNYKEIHTKTSGDFTPSNGFTTFRRATPDEIKMLDNTFTTDALE